MTGHSLAHLDLARSGISLAFLPLQNWLSDEQWLPITSALKRIFPLSKVSFWWMSIKCFHDNIEVCFPAVAGGI